MKKHYVLSALLLITTSLGFAQKDVAIIGVINPDTTENLPYNFNDSLKILFFNVGAPLAVGDTVSVVVSATPQNINITQDSVIILRLPVVNTPIPSGVGAILTSPPASLAPLLGLFIGQDIEFCFKGNLDTDTDVNLNNNTYCYTYTISDPAIEPNSVQTLQDEAVSITYINNQLMLNKKPAGSILNVYNILGERVFSNSSAQMVYSLNLNTGIYIAQLEDGQQILKTVKILVP